jgi:hypothetical protein
MECEGIGMNGRGRGGDIVVDLKQTCSSLGKKKASEE